MAERAEHDMTAEHFDVLIVRCRSVRSWCRRHLHQRCPGKRYVILEGRPSIGGTWDLFRYPGIRSDSDMHTLGYRFKPWCEAKSDCRRRVDPQVCEGDRRRVRCGPAHSLRAPRNQGRVVEPGRRLDRGGAAPGHREDRPLLPATSCSCVPGTTATATATRPSSRALNALRGY